MKVNYSYLKEQFQNPDEILIEIKEFLKTCQFTLGPEVKTFEESFAKLLGAAYAIGVGNGTDALKLALKAIGVGPGDEVITVSNTFIATIGAIVELGAKPVFVDVTDYYTMDYRLIEAAITSKTKAILPVHLTGQPADMPEIMEIAKKHNLLVIEDACQAIGAEINGKKVGTWGDAAAFSLHPLKNLNVWGDGGMITTNSKYINELTKLYRNHGMKNRDEVITFGMNSRLDSIQAIVGNHLIKDIHQITNARIANAKFYDQAFSKLNEKISFAPTRSNAKSVYHLYVIQSDERDKLGAYLNENGIESKVHYPIPVHLQEASKYLDYKRGSLPKTEKQCNSILSLPVHQYLSLSQLEYVTETIRKFCWRGTL